MMVIRGTATIRAAETGPPVVAALTITDGIFPADRCVWEQSQQMDTSNYEISNAHFVAGNGTYNPIANPELGYIGKSGRFVGMTV